MEIAQRKSTKSLFRTLVLTVTLLLVQSCRPTDSSDSDMPAVDGQAPDSNVELVVLGTVQDGGSPHIGCKKSCCRDLFAQPDPSRKVVSLGLVDHRSGSRYIFEATPDMPAQLRLLNTLTTQDSSDMPDGIFVTHAHIGHYTGLMYLGKEATNASEIPVYTLPRMTDYLTNNGPWSQLVANGNIRLQPITTDSTVQLAVDISVQAVKVPHRDEYSETAGFIISGPERKALFIPDIDKWAKWETDISKLIATVDYAFVDATFYNAAEVAYRDISLIPHPFVVESMELFDSMSDVDKAKVRFIHLNHTNPLLDKSTTAYKTVLEKGYKIAQLGDRLLL